MREFHDQPPNVEAALHYASRCGWAVLPMQGKKFYNSDGVRMATRDPNIIKQWGWAENVGMACGEPSRTDVFDIDDLAAAGFDVDALAASTLAATTPSGGRHLFFEFAGLRSRSYSFGRMEIDRPCGCAATSARATVAQRSESAASAARAD